MPTTYDQMGDGTVTPTVQPPPAFKREADELKKYDDNDELGFTDMEKDELDDIEHDLSSLKFGEEIKILLIPTADWRLICHFLGVNATRDVKTANYSNVMMIGSMMAECLDRFMKSLNYKFSGEIMFDQSGQAVPVGTKTWILKGEEVTFTNMGFRFYEAPSGKKGDNLVFQVWEHANSGQAGFSCYHKSLSKAKHALIELEKFTKKNNGIRGCKLRDVNMSTGSFQEVSTDPRYTWDNYYFPQNIREMFELEVFGFLKNTERYNKVGIKKRGVMLHGPPGTGKTTIGHIICNNAKDSTVIWITPDLIAENENGKTSIKLLYMLTDFVAPSVIMLEDLDLFSEDREGVVDHLRLGALMNILDGVNSVTNAVTVATTNRLSLVEKALSNRPGRFDRVVEIPYLEADLRRRMFEDRLKGCKVGSGVIEHLVDNSDKWTGAEAQEFINSLNLYFINKNQDNNRVVTVKVVDSVLKTMETLCLQAKARSKVGFSTDERRFKGFAAEDE
jgi:hypothetical protein